MRAALGDREFRQLVIIIMCVRKHTLLTLAAAAEMQTRTMLLESLMDRCDTGIIISQRVCDSYIIAFIRVGDFRLKNEYPTMKE